MTIRRRVPMVHLLLDSPAAANLGLKAIYIWAGLLVSTTSLLYFFYPEVSTPAISL